MNVRSVRVPNNVADRVMLVTKSSMKQARKQARRVYRMTARPISLTRCHSYIPNYCGPRSVDLIPVIFPEGVMLFTWVSRCAPVARKLRSRDHRLRHRCLWHCPRRCAARPRTSSASMKLIHGGLRHHEYFEFRLVGAQPHRLRRSAFFSLTWPGRVPAMSPISRLKPLPSRFRRACRRDRRSRPFQ